MRKTAYMISVVEVKQDIRVLGAERLECFDSTAWNRYYSIELIINIADLFNFSEDDIYKKELAKQ